MKKIKFKIEYVPLSDARIESHKDFSALMAAYTAHPKPGWKERWLGKKLLVYTGGIITGALVSSMIWWSATQTGEDEMAFVFQPEVQQSASIESGAVPEQLSADSLNRSVDTTMGSLDQEFPFSAKTGDRKGGMVETVPELRFSKAGAGLNDPEMNADKPDKASGVNVQAESVEKREEVTGIYSELGTEPDGKSGAAVWEEQSKPDAIGTDKSTVENQDPSPPNSVLLRSMDSIVGSTTGIALNEIYLGDDSLSDRPLPLDSMDSEIISATETAPDPAASGDSSKKKAWVLFPTITLPKVDLNDEWQNSKTVVSNTADSMVTKTGNFFSRIFSDDSGTARSISPTSGVSLVQDELCDTFRYRVAQVSFVTPLSTDGIDAVSYEHSFSLNILQGYTGAVRGVEFGGLANINQGFMYGAQFGGLVNFVFCDVKGAQFAGLYNNGRHLKGYQAAGLLNIVTGNVLGMQTAGVFNYAGDTITGVQLAGVANLQVAKRNSNGLQLAGVSNVALGSLKGGQVSGVYNFSNDHQGIQTALINTAKYIKGFQLGLINLADSIDGEALGLISISRNGIHHIDLFTNEILYANVALKLGSPHVYTLFGAGVAPKKDTVRLGFGIGIGGHAQFGKAFFDVDGICWTIHNDNLNDWEEVNLFNQLRIMGGYQVAKGVALYAGPSLNVHVYDDRYPGIAPYTIYENSGNTNVTGWIGFVAGIQFL